MPKVFISYRRADSSPCTGRLFDRMVEAFGKDKVFMDVYSIEPGVDFDDLIRKSVASCDVLLAVIGPQWLNVQGADGKRRLDNEDEIDRHEIATALGRDILVIPVLMGEARMAAEGDLPAVAESLFNLAALYMQDGRFDQAVPLFQSAGGNRRETAWPRASGCGAFPGAARRCLPGRGPLRAGRAAL